MTFTGSYEVDFVGAPRPRERTQRQIEDLGSADLDFSVTDTGSPARGDRLDVVFDDLWWIDSTVTASRGLESVRLLAVSFHVGRGVLRGHLARVAELADDPRSHWRIVIEQESVSGPPKYPVIVPLEEARSRDGLGEVAVRRTVDGVVERIDLWLPAGGTSETVRSVSR